MTEAFQLRLRTFQVAAFIAGLLGLLACFIGAAFQTRQFYFSYLFGYLFWLGLALGCLIITMIQYLTGGRWGYPVRRFLEAGFSTLPLMLLLFIPVLVGLRELYPWARPEEVAASEALPKRQPYMSVPWFIVRALFFFAVWLAMAWFLRRRSLAQDTTTEVGPSRALRVLSGVGVLIYPLTATFAYIDWILSLEPKWYSTMFPLIILSGQVLAAFAFVTILLRLFEHQEPIAGTVNRLIYHQLGNLLLTFVMFWTYVAFGQLLVIYSGNLPHEISWYLHRIANHWKAIVAVIALFHFFLPFFLLLFRVVKQHARYLVTIAVVLFVVHIVNVYWLVMPSFHREGVRVSWLDFAAPIGVGGVWLAAFLWRLQRAPLLPANDPRMEEEMAYGTH